MKKLLSLSFQAGVPFVLPILFIGAEAMDSRLSVPLSAYGWAAVTGIAAAALSFVSEKLLERIQFIAALIFLAPIVALITCYKLRPEWFGHPYTPATNPAILAVPLHTPTWLTHMVLATDPVKVLIVLSIPLGAAICAGFPNFVTTAIRMYRQTRRQRV
jgi:hypothetical protein